MENGKCIIQCRLRAGKDDDLRKAIDELPASRDKSDVLRDALRLYFFGGHQNPPVNVEEVKKEESVQLEKMGQPDNVVTSKLDDLLGSF